MRVAWPSLLIALGGLVLVLVGVVEARNLARAAHPTGAPRRRAPKPRIRPDIPSELYAAPSRPANFARFVFLDPRAQTFYSDWDRAARDTAETLRAAAGRDPAPP